MAHEELRRIFVTGGAGFIGSHLVDRLISDGCQVTVYDNLSSGKIEWIEHHFDNEDFTFIEADLLNLETLKKSLDGCEVVWHFGSNTDIPIGSKQTDIDLKHCVIATYNVLEAMRQTGVKYLLFASSGSVYGELEEIPTSENSGPLLPLSLYAAGKLSGEAFISAYCHLFDLRAWIFRFGNVVGSRMGHGAIYDFMHKLRRNPEELEVLGDGHQEKNYFLVEECLDGMFYAFHNIPMTADKPADIFNLGTNTTTKVTTIARIVKEEMGLPDVPNRFTGGKRGWPGDQPQVFLSIERMNKLGWRAQHTSDEAVRIAARRLIQALDQEFS